MKKLSLLASISTVTITLVIFLSACGQGSAKQAGDGEDG